MRLYRINPRGVPALATRVQDDRFVLIETPSGKPCNDLSEFFSYDRKVREDMLRFSAVKADDDRSFLCNDVSISSPIEGARQDIICLAENYMTEGAALPPETVNTVYFSKRFCHATGDGEMIPAHSDVVQKLDYETELLIILGETVYNVSASEAMDAVFGYQKHISAKSKDKPTIVVDFSKEKSIRSDDNESVRVFHVQEPDELAAMLTFWYENGSELDWNAFCKADGLHRTPAPIYPFERKSFWIEPKQPASNTSAAVKTVRSEAPASPAVTLPQKKFFLICSENVSDISLSDYPYSDPDFRSVFAPETAEIGTDSRLAMLKYISQAGVQPDILLADQNGKAIYSFSKGRISSKRLVEAADLPDYTNIDKIISNIESAAKTNAVTVFDFCRSDALSKHSWNGAVRIVPVFSEGAFSDYLKNPEQTIQVAVPAVSETAEPIQTEQSAAPSSAAAAAVTEKTQELIDAELFLEKTWAKAFNLDGEIGHDEDFFALGGNSLIMQSMSDEINDHFNKKFDIFEIYDYETIEKLAAKILEED